MSYFYDDNLKYVKLDDMKDGNIYHVYSRDSYDGTCVAIYRGKGLFNTINHAGFSNWRFGLKKELHWDADSKYGTVKPVKNLGKCPSHLNDDKLVHLLVILSKPIWQKQMDDDMIDGVLSVL